MKSRKTLLAAVAIALSLAAGSAAAQAPNCIDQARSTEEADQCGGPLLAIIDAEFKRLGEKFKGNEKMQEMLQTTKQNWNKHRSSQCMFESMAASGGQTIKPFSLEANKAYFKCAIRTLDEMKKSLEKF